MAQIDEGMAKQTKAQPLAFRSIAGVAVVAESVCDDATHSSNMEMLLRDAHTQGKQDERQAFAREMEQRIDLERQAIGRMAQKFEAEKKRYFADVEAEVVRLSLAIAERVLHREAAMDPMLLAGAARVALEQVADTSEAVLRVSAGELQAWSEALLANSKTLSIEADNDLPAGECELQTRSGTVQLGLRAQLQEIERGFFELMGCKPAIAA